MIIELTGSSLHMQVLSRIILQNGIPLALETGISDPQNGQVGIQKKKIQYLNKGGYRVHPLRGSIFFVSSMVSILTVLRETYRVCSLKQYRGRVWQCFVGRSKKN